MKLAAAADLKGAYVASERSAPVRAGVLCASSASKPSRVEEVLPGVRTGSSALHFRCMAQGNIDLDLDDLLSEPELDAT